MTQQKVITTTRSLAYSSGWHKTSDSSTTGHSEVNTPISGARFTMSSTVTYGPNIPDWKRRIQLGQNATTDMSGSVQRISKAQEGYFEAGWRMSTLVGNAYESRQETGRGYIGMEQSPFHTNPSLVIISTATADNRALARYNARVAQVNRQFQGGVFFGELAEALHGIRHPAEALFKGIESYSSAATKLRRSYVKSKADFLSKSSLQRRKVAKAFSQAAGGLWLERSFHWLPLMADIRGAISAMEATLDTAPRQMVRATATDEVSRTYTQSQASGSTLFPVLVSDLMTRGATVKYYGVVRVGPRNPGVPDLKALGFDPRSFFPTIWELIPYSWAVDYFTNIGDIIYGASYGGTDVDWTARGTKVWAKRSQRSGVPGYSFIPNAGWKTDYVYAQMKSSEVDAETANISRATYSGYYIPGLDYNIPGMSLKWLNLGALFLQRSASFL